MARPVFDSKEKRLEFIDRINQIDGVNLPPEKADRNPRIPLDLFLKESEFNKLISILDWYLDQIQ